MSETPVLEVRGISKSFGRVRALRDINMGLVRHEVVGLVGDNAAGKSTLLKILAGVYRPDAGEILVEGRRVEIQRPIHARNLGIETVYQDFMLAPNLSVTDNIFLGRDITSWGMLGKLQRGKMDARARDVLDRIRFQLPLKTRVDELSGGQRQTVAIARALLYRPKVILLDEPTASLSVKVIEQVQDLIRILRDEGTSCIYVSHRLPDILAVADRVVVLRTGEIVAERKRESTDLEEIVRLIMGVPPARSGERQH